MSTIHVMADIVYNLADCFVQYNAVNVQANHSTQNAR